LLDLNNPRYRQCAPAFEQPVLIDSTQLMAQRYRFLAQSTFAKWYQNTRRQLLHFEISGKRNNEDGPCCSEQAIILKNKNGALTCLF
jgi:hypothetical protein